MKSSQFPAIALLLFAAAPAFAEDAKPVPVSPLPSQPAFVPITLSQEDVDAITKFLSDKPYSTAAPIINFLAAREAESQAAKAAPQKK